MAAALQSMTTTLDAPIGGWDAFHSIDNMPPENAILLDNLIPGVGTVDTRLGSIVYADTGTGLPVETVADYHPRSNASSRLVAASAGGVWDVTGGLAPSGASSGGPAQLIDQLAPVGTFGSSRWQTSNFQKEDETGVLIMCNGVDPVQIYNGAVLAPALFTEEDGTPIVKTFIGVCIFKGRAYYWDKDDNAFWYCQPGSFQGWIQKFDLGSFASEGGAITLITSWTQQDSGDGKDDFFVVAFDSGQTFVYQGDDPETIGYWELVGIYTMAEPLSIRGATRYGADTILMTKDGFVALSTMVQQGRTSDVPAFSRMIHGAIKRETSLRGAVYGWEANLFEKQGLFVFNVPLSDKTFVQFVLNTVTQRWCRFRGLNVNCFDVHNDRLFGGAQDGTILACLEGTSDLGNPIQFSAIPAYGYLGAPGNNKHLVAAQPLTTHSDPSFISIEGYADYAFPVVNPVIPRPAQERGIWSINPATPPSPTGSFWDEAFWANEDSPVTTKGWQNISAYGYAVSYLLRFAEVNETVSWRATTVRYFVAGAQ